MMLFITLCATFDDYRVSHAHDGRRFRLCSASSYPRLTASSLSFTTSFHDDIAIPLPLQRVAPFSGVRPPRWCTHYESCRHYPIANTLLAIGASPLMAHAQQEIQEISAISAALSINIGTLSPSWIEAMQLAAMCAHRDGKPWAVKQHPPRVAWGFVGYHNCANLFINIV